MKKITLYTVEKHYLTSGNILLPRIGWPTEWFSPIFRYKVRTWKTWAGAMKWIQKHKDFGPLPVKFVLEPKIYRIFRG